MSFDAHRLHICDGWIRIGEDSYFYPVIRDGSDIVFQLRKYGSAIKEPLVRLNLLEEDDWTDLRSVMIVSTGRTGTHFFSHFFSQNFENTYAVHEPQPDSFYLNQRFVRKKISKHRAEKMFRELRHELYLNLKRQGYKNYVESNPNIVGLLPVAKKVFPKHKIVHIVRDGREVVRSLYSRYVYGKWVGTVPYLDKHDPRRRLSATFFPDDPYAPIWKEMTRFEKICWIWAKKMRLFRNQSKTILTPGLTGSLPFSAKKTVLFGVT